MQIHRSVMYCFWYFPWDRVINFVIGFNTNFISEIRLHLHERCLYSKFFWSLFFRIRTEYVDLQSKSPFSVRMRENVGLKNSECGHFSRGVRYWKKANVNVNTHHFLQIFVLWIQYKMPAFLELFCFHFLKCFQVHYNICAKRLYLDVILQFL